MESEERTKNSHFLAENASKKRTYTDEELVQALKKLKEEGKSSISEVARKYHIPRQTLVNKFYGKSPITCTKPGPEAVLGNDAEKTLENWILDGYRRGFAMPKELIFYSVRTVIDEIPERNRRMLPFLNNCTPGRGWFTSFKKRHPEVRDKYNESLKSNRQCLDSDIKAWFSDAEAIIDEHDAKDAIFDPTRIFIMDEIILKFSTDNKLILSDKKKYLGKSIENDNGNEFAFLFATSAEGKIVPPVTICKSSDSSKSLVNLLQNYWQPISTDCGTLTYELFHDYIVDTFYPYLVEKQCSFPIILFLGCDFPYFSLPLSNFCQENGLCMISLPRNSKEIQPVDWTIHHILNQLWENSDMDLEQDRISLQNYILASLYHHIRERYFEQFIIQRFQSNKLYPFGPDRESRTDVPLFRDLENYPRNSTIDYMERQIAHDILAQFRHCRYEEIPWNGEIQYQGLYDVWLAMVIDAKMESLCEEEKLICSEEEGDTNTEWMILEEEELDC